MTKPRSVAATANDNSIPGSRLEAGTVSSDKIQNGAITADKIGDGAVVTNKVQNGAITADKIGDNSIVDAKINDNAAIQSNKLEYRRPTNLAQTVPLSVEEKLNDIASVKDFGAIGDGVADDTEAIRTALQRARSVFFPPGTYRVTSTINIGTQRVLMGAFPQANWVQNGLSLIRASISDIGDGNPIFQAAATGNTQALTFKNLSFHGDKAVNASDLSQMDSSGLVGVNVRGLKQGAQFLNCAFRNLKSAVRDDIGTGDYLDKITFSQCFFTGMFLALKLRPTGHLSLDNCYFDECFNWINSSRIYLNATRFNNSSFSSEQCQIQGTVILADSVYIEGGNRWFRPLRFLSCQACTFSEAFSQVGSTKFSCEIEEDGVVLEFKGCRIGTNTRLIRFSGANPSTVTVKLQACFDGSAFGNVSNIQHYLDLGLKVEGYSNEQDRFNVSTLATNYQIPDFGYSNLIQDKPRPALDTTDWVLENGRHKRSFLFNSPGANNTTKTIILRSPSFNKPGAAIAVVTVIQLGDSTGLSSRRITQDRVVWLTEGENRSNRTASVTRLLEEFQNSSTGSQSSSTTVAAAASIDTENVCTITVNAINTTLSTGKLLITVDVETAFD